MIGHSRLHAGGYRSFASKLYAFLAVAAAPFGRAELFSHLDDTGKLLTPGAHGAEQPGDCVARPPAVFYFVI